MLGLKRGTVKLTQSSDAFKKLFIQEKQYILENLQLDVLGLEHIGSTAIQGIQCKPIIDMILGIASLDSKTSKPYIIQLEKIGYTYMHDFTDRLFFVKGGESKRTHHLNLVVFESQEQWTDKINFRDYLNHHPAIAKEYSQLKSKLALSYPNNRKLYTQAKSQFIEGVLSSKSVK